jgi:hypothetical protein
MALSLTGNGSHIDPCGLFAVTTNATYYNFPYVVGCYGPGTFWKNGTRIDYTPIKGLIDTSCT